MNKLNSKRSRRVYFGVFIVLFTLIIYFGYQWIKPLWLESTRTRLFESPEPITATINAIAPFPGTTYPSDDRSFPSSSYILSIGGNVCVRVNSLFFDSTFSSIGQAAYYVSPDKVDLFLNGDLVDSQYPHAHIYGEEVEPKVIVLSDISYPRMIVAEPGVFVPIDFCWNLDLPRGIYLAEIVIKKSLFESIRYKWAFTINH